MTVLDPRRDFDDNRSVWWQSAPPTEPFPPARGEISADVAIIGGGFTGCSTAYHLARRFPDKRIVLLEARRIANGASGRNGGLMLNWITGVDVTAPERAAEIHRVTRAGIDRIAGIIAEHGLDVRWRRDGALNLFTDPRRADAAAAEVEALAPTGLPLQYLTGPALAARCDAAGVYGAIYDPTEGHLDGVSYLRALTPVLTSLGVAIYENTPVLRVEEGATCRLTTPDATVRAPAIVLATNVWGPKLGYFKGQVFPLHSHVVATAPLSRAEWAARGLGEGSGYDDDLDRIAYGCLSERGELVFGGGSNAAYDYVFGGGLAWHDRPTRAFDAVTARLRAYHPRAADVPIAHRWTGTLGLTLARVCAMGVRGAHRNVYYAFGYSGHGITLANMAGEVICDIYSDADERWRGLPFYQPKLYWIPPEPMRWVGYQLFTRATGRSPRRRG
ncbi:MAG: FAD-dependent oxidoreductase [Myxococcales bacterium]|nr:FAD-dependent oxidoreductase [Myxococcales bacterium]MCB9553957.1 FAD-dependent oxidoreductase [Myxococcales bacterium]